MLAMRPWARLSELGGCEIAARRASEVMWLMSNTGHCLRLSGMSRRRCYGALRGDFCQDAMRLCGSWFEKCFEGASEEGFGFSRSH